MTRDEVWAELKRRDIRRAEVDFSGGNDDGGVERITLWPRFEAVEGGPVEATPIILSEYKPEEADRPLVKGLCDPVYGKYYTFAGDFYVTGKVIWDADTRKVTMNGEEEVPSTSSFEEEC